MHFTTNLYSLVSEAGEFQRLPFGFCPTSLPHLAGELSARFCNANSQTQFAMLNNAFFQILHRKVRASDADKTMWNSPAQKTCEQRLA